MQKHTILFLTANPSGTDRLTLDQEAKQVGTDEEASAILKELKSSDHWDRFDLVTQWAAEPHDLLRQLRELKPTVVHLSSHGGHRGRSALAAPFPCDGNHPNMPDAATYQPHLNAMSAKQRLALRPSAQTPADSSLELHCE